MRQWLRQLEISWNSSQSPGAKGEQDNLDQVKRRYRGAKIGSNIKFLVWYLFCFIFTFIPIVSMYISNLLFCKWFVTKGLLTLLLIYLLFCLTLLQPHEQWNPPESSLHEISQARIMEWVAISFCRGSSQLKD